MQTFIFTSELIARNYSIMASQLDQFHLFPKLPEAIRQRIWHQAAFVPRVAKIHEKPSTSFGSNTPKHGECNTMIQSKTRPPALLHACKESRALGLAEIYAWAYEGCGNCSWHRDAPIYVNATWISRIAIERVVGVDVAL